MEAVGGHRAKGGTLTLMHYAHAHRHSTPSHDHSTAQHTHHTLIGEPPPSLQLDAKSETKQKIVRRKQSSGVTISRSTNKTLRVRPA